MALCHTRSCVLACLPTKIVLRSSSSDKILQVTEIRSANRKQKILFTSDPESNSWKKSTINDETKRLQQVTKFLLPAQYPASVASGYLPFSLLAFGASVAGSGGMVLSTQTLLLAVGVVGSESSATVMAGALNWVLKDGVGQLGGVIFASRMGESKRFDSDPKRWRMTAALALDTAALMEILSPFLPIHVLPVACVATVLKNIGFLSASASRAALHQSLAISGNLADVTAKAGSQSMAASLVGTAAGIGLSSLLGHDASNFVLGFVGCSLTHQLCNYQSLHHVALRHLNLHRLNLVLQEYTSTGTVLSPAEVAKKEQYLPLVRSEDASSWLSIGSRLEDINPSGRPEDFQRILYGKHAINLEHDRIHLVFLDVAAGEDLIFGIFHAMYLHEEQQRHHIDSYAAIQKSYERAKNLFPTLVEDLHKQGWQTDPALTTVEPSGSVRLQIIRETG